MLTSSFLNYIKYKHQWACCLTFKYSAYSSSCSVLQKPFTCKDLLQGYIMYVIYGGYFIYGIHVHQQYFLHAHNSMSMDKLAKANLFR